LNTTKPSKELVGILVVDPRLESLKLAALKHLIQPCRLPEPLSERGIGVIGPIEDLVRRRELRQRRESRIVRREREVKVEELERRQTNVSTSK